MDDIMGSNHNVRRKMSYSPLTESFISTLSLQDRKEKGQYMTPAAISDRLAESLVPEGEILDPAVGTGELLLAIERLAPGSSLHGFDIDSGMVSTAMGNVPSAEFSEISLFSDMWREHVGQYDSIIANPPYFEIKKDDPRLLGIQDFELVKQKNGRLNIYALFFEYSFRLLKKDGRLAFLIPPSMNNGKYFAPLRELILQTGYITKLEILRDNKLFSDALTSTQIIVIQKSSLGYEKNAELSQPFLFGSSHKYVFTDNKDFLSQYWMGKKSIRDHGSHVFTGKIVWNQHKEDFTTEDKGIPLYYSKDITKEHSLSLSEKIPQERRWLEVNGNTRKRILTGKSILVNRIVGSLSNPQIRFAFVDEEQYFAENHVNVIQGGDIQSLYNKLLNLSPSETVKYLQALTGNTQLSAKELENMLPL